MPPVTTYPRVENARPRKEGISDSQMLVVVKAPVFFSRQKVRQKLRQIPGIETGWILAPGMPRSISLLCSSGTSVCHRHRNAPFLGYSFQNGFWKSSPFQPPKSLQSEVLQGREIKLHFSPKFYKITFKNENYCARILNIFSVLLPIFVLSNSPFFMTFKMKQIKHVLGWWLLLSFVLFSVIFISSSFRLLGPPVCIKTLSCIILIKERKINVLEKLS